MQVYLVIFVFVFCALSHGSNAATSTWPLKRSVNKRLTIASAPQRAPFCSTTSGSKPADKSDLQVLEKLYRATNGSHWSSSSKWLNGDPCVDGWYGVCCNSQGGVTELNLELNSLKGVLPSDIFLMTSLQVMNFSYNELSGPLPEKIAMPSVMSIDLSFNMLQGLAPKTWDCPELRTLITFENELNGSLPTFGSGLKKIEVLDLSHNHFSGSFPSEYGDYISLKQLQLYDNLFDFTLNDFPSSWLKLKKMEEFGVESLQGQLPSTIGTDWPNMKDLQISIGDLTGNIPSSFCNWRNLTSLAIIYNPMTGSIPDCIGNLSNLMYLFISQTYKLSGAIPESIGKLKNLRQMDLSENDLSGDIPSSFSSLSNLSLLYLQDNNLTGFGSGLESLFERFGDANCNLSDNPFHCPLPHYTAGCQTSQCKA